MEENVYFLGHRKDLSSLNEGAVKRVSFHQCSRDWKVADGKSRRRGIRQMLKMMRCHGVSWSQRES